MPAFIDICARIFSSTIYFDARKVYTLEVLADNRTVFWIDSTVVLFISCDFVFLYTLMVFASGVLVWLARILVVAAIEAITFFRNALVIFIATKVGTGSC